MALHGDVRRDGSHARSNMGNLRTPAKKRELSNSFTETTSTSRRPVRNAKRCVSKHGTRLSQRGTNHCDLAVGDEDEPADGEPPAGFTNDIFGGPDFSVEGLAESNPSVDIQHCRLIGRATTWTRGPGACDYPFLGPFDTKDLGLADRNSRRSAGMEGTGGLDTSAGNWCNLDSEDVRYSRAYFTWARTSLAPPVVWLPDPLMRVTFVSKFASCQFPVTPPRRRDRDRTVDRMFRRITHVHFRLLSRGFWLRRRRRLDMFDR